MYKLLLTTYPDSLLLKTDTDLLLYQIFIKDLNKDMKQNSLLQEHFEFSNYYNRKKQVGLLQDESIDGSIVLISEYVRLREL